MAEIVPSDLEPQILGTSCGADRFITSLLRFKNNRRTLTLHPPFPDARMRPRFGVANVKQTTPAPVRRLGVGIDTARYGHYVSFLRDDKRTALPALTIAEADARVRPLPTASMTRSKLAASGTSSDSGS